MLTWSSGCRTAPGGWSASSPCARPALVQRRDVRRLLVARVARGPRALRRAVRGARARPGADAEPMVRLDLLLLLRPRAGRAGVRHAGARRRRDGRAGPWSWAAAWTRSAAPVRRGLRADARLPGAPLGAERSRPPAGWPLPNNPFVSVSAHLGGRVVADRRPDGAREVAERALRVCLPELEFPYGPFSAAYLHSHLALIKRLEGDHESALHPRAEMKAAGGRARVRPVHRRRRHPRGPEPASGPATRWRSTSSSRSSPSGASCWPPRCGRRTSSPSWRRRGVRRSPHRGLRVAAGGPGRRDRDGRGLLAPNLRVRGELRCEDGDDGGLDDLRAAVETARRQGASALESRALTSLQAAEALAAS